jgi:hypothetical protein
MPNGKQFVSQSHARAVNSKRHPRNFAKHTQTFAANSAMGFFTIRQTSLIALNQLPPCESRRFGSCRRQGAPIISQDLRIIGRLFLHAVLIVDHHLSPRINIDLNQKCFWQTGSSEKLPPTIDGPSAPKRDLQCLPCADDDRAPSDETLTRQQGIQYRIDLLLFCLSAIGLLAFQNNAAGQEEQIAQF